MDEIEKVRYAKSFIDKLAQGINPLDNKPVPDNDLVNNVRLVRCFFYVSQLLQDVIDGKTIKQTRKKKKQFCITSQQILSFDYDEKPTTLLEFKNKINLLVDTSFYKKVTYAELKNWLVNIKAIYIAEDDMHRQRKFVTDYGKSLGFSEDKRISLKGNDYSVMVMNNQAQKFMLENLNNILKLN